jgi:hypothetical protein
VGLLLISVASFGAFCLYFFFPVTSPTENGQQVYDVDLAGDRQFGLIAMALLALVGIGLAVFGRRSSAQRSARVPEPRGR